MQKLLIIKFGAFGDFISSFRSFAAIRQHFPQAEMTLLTKRPCQSLAIASKWFNRVWIDDRPAVGQMHQFFSLRARMIAANFDLVIDLQNTERTNLYYHLLIPQQPLWSGGARGCSNRLSRREQKKHHAIDREATQLAQLGIAPLEQPNLNWMSRAAGHKNHRITAQTLLLAPGYAPAQKTKCWPAERYAEVANRLVERGWQIILIGTKDDIQHNRRIRRLCHEVRDLTEETNLVELAMLGQQAGLALGNDNGVMRLLANCGCQSLFLLADAIAPAAQHVDTLQREDIRLIEVEDVLKMVGEPILPPQS